MIFLEFRKLLIKQKGIIIILVMLFLKVAFMLYQGVDTHYIIAENPEGYKYYIEHYSGKLTEEKEKDIKEEYRQVINAQARIDEFRAKWQEGEINRRQYDEQSKQYLQRIRNTSVFNVIYNQYFYAKEAPQDRYIMDTRGWHTLLSNSTPDFILILCLVILLTPLFCNEYESSMEGLLLSCVRGKYKAGIAKLFTGMILSVFITIAFSTLEYLSLNLLVGMKNGSFPLQSLQYFENSIYRISLNQAFGVVVFCRILGAALMALLISMISIISKKSIITLFTASAVTILPYIILKAKTALYLLPLPSGLLSGTGYIWGTQYVSIYNQSGSLEQSKIFQQIKKHEFYLLIIFYCLEILFLFAYSLKLYSKFKINIHKIRGKTSGVLSCFLVIIMVCMLSSCSAGNVYVKGFSFSFDTQQLECETEEYKIHLEVETNKIIAEDKKSREKINLTRDPFQGNDRIKGIYTYKGWCYYLVKNTDELGMQIFGIDLTNFYQKFIFSNIESNHENYFGLKTEKTDISEGFLSMADVSCFFLNESFIYYTWDSKLIRIDRKSGKEKTLITDVMECKSLVYLDGDIYYIDKQYRLKKYNEENGSTIEVGSIITDYFTIAGNKITYRDIIGDYKMHDYIMQD